MKKRRTLVISLLLVAALCLGIGYAAISDVLVVDGTITINEQPFRLVYTEYTHGNASSNHVTSEVMGNIAGTTVAKLNVSGFTMVEDKLVGTFTVKNENDVTLYVSEDPIVKCGNESTTLSVDGCDNFDCTVEWTNDAVHTTGIAPNATASFTVTIILDEIPSELSQNDVETFTHYFRIDIPATSVAPTLE